MIRIEVDGGDVRECAASGNVLQIAAEIAVAVRILYRVACGTNRPVAEMFRSEVSGLLGEGGQAWDASAAGGRGFYITTAPPDGE